MELDYPHSLSKEEARERMEALGDYLKNRHGIKLSWEGDRGSFKGKYLVVNIEGSFTLRDDKVELRGKDPGRLWRKKAMDYLKRKLATYLDPQTPVDKLPRG